MSVDPFYDIEPGVGPEYVLVADEVMPIEDLPEQSQQLVLRNVQVLRALHADDPLAFEIATQFVAACIDEKDEPGTDPRDEAS